MRTVLMAGMLLWIAGWCAAERVVIRNAEPRRDDKGEILDAHDGCLMRFGGKYYLYGTAYGRSDGFGKTNRYRCYSSPDLVQWHLEGELLKSPPEGVYYRPYVIYNARTKKYVLWYNWYAKLWEGLYGVATSDKPEGPFEIQSPRVEVARKEPGDHGLFVDDDGKAYLIYTSIPNRHGISIDRLSPDYLASTRENSGFLAHGCEAPALFKCDGRYYAVFDNTCAFCPQGSGARVCLADKPLGPYADKGNINRKEGKPIIAAQQTHIAQLPTASGTVLIWMGDRWKSNADGIKGHDLQFWSEPLKFNADGTIQPIRWVDQWTIELAK